MPYSIEIQAPVAGSTVGYSFTAVGVAETIIIEPPDEPPPEQAQMLLTTPNSSPVMICTFGKGAVVYGTGKAAFEEPDWSVNVVVNSSAPAGTGYTLTAMIEAGESEVVFEGNNTLAAP